MEGSSWPCRRVPASARLGGNISVATFGPCRCVVASSSRRVVDASSSPRRRRVIVVVVVVVASSSRRVVAASLSVPASILTGIPTVVVAVAVVAVSSVPASILPRPRCVGQE